MTDLVSRLLEAIGKAEQLARDAGGGTWETNCACLADECKGYPDCERVEGDGIRIYPEGGHDAAQAEHIAHNDPSSVLRRCAADRKLIKHIQDQWDAAYGEPGTVLPNEWATALRILAEAYGLEVTE